MAALGHRPDHKRILADHVLYLRLEIGDMENVEPSQKSNDPSTILVATHTVLLV